MQNIIYFTQGPVATTTELNAILTIQQEIAQNYQLRVFNENESPAFGAGPAPADYANGAVPPAYAHLPKFTGVSGGGLSMPGFVYQLQTMTRTGADDQEVTLNLSDLGITGTWYPSMRIASMIDGPDVTLDDGVIKFTFYAISEAGYILFGLQNDNSEFIVIPIQIL